MYYLEHDTEDAVCAELSKFAIEIKYIYWKSMFDIKTNGKKKQLLHPI